MQVLSIYMKYTCHAISSLGLVLFWASSLSCSPFIEYYDDDDDDDVVVVMNSYVGNRF